MLRLIQSNYMPVLAKLFCEQSQQPADPFTTTTVVVQSFGIGQWLKLQLARQQGIAANIDCILPANYIWQLYRELLPDIELPEESPFDRERLSWRLMRLIPDTNHEPLQRYLDAPGDPDMRLFQLSFQIAQLFDQYLVYRPEWPLAWERGQPLLPDNVLNNQNWQVELWQQVIRDAGDIAELHRARLHQRLLAKIKSGTALPGKLGTSLSIFGLSSIARTQLETFHSLAEIIDVDVYFLNPCQHYWGDIVAPRDKAKRSIRALLGQQGATQLSDEDYLTVGNPLLGSMGKQGREYLELLLEIDSVDTYEAFVPLPDESLLGSIKTDILNLEYGGCFDETPEPTQLQTDDHSVQVHAVHSRMREVEVLYDQLLAVFERHPEINPVDVIVMAPDISTYSPFINAVFKDKIHFGIADRTLLQQSTLIASFFKIIALPASRLSSVEVMDLLEVPAIARRFGLDEENLNRLSTWISETGIRWEFDGDEKSQRWGLPAENMNTWRFGLDRLLLGYAMDEKNGMYADRLPYPVDAGDSELLGVLCHIIDLLDRTRASLSRSHGANGWHALLNRILHDFFEPLDAETLDIEQLQGVLDQLERDTLSAGYNKPFSHQLMRFWLEQQLSLGHQVPSFITGGITFATLVPMRSIPFTVVCLLGMNDADFPREERPVSFDLMHIDGARKGDRAKRTDDRYLFLEALLSAQQLFYVSHQGKGARDNQNRPPSTVVGELMDYITGIYPAFSVTEHPLQPFSHHYYNGDLISYRQMWYDALQHPPIEEPFIHSALSPQEDLKAESMEQLVGFFRNPARYYLQHCLGVYFEDNSIELRESESFVLDGLEKYQLTDHALLAIIHGVDKSDWHREMVAAGVVLNNALGNSYLEQQYSIASNIFNELDAVVQNEPASLRDTVSVGRRTLSFTIHNLYDKQRIDIRPGVLRKRQLIEVWIKHLFLNAAGHHFQSMTISRGKTGADLTLIDPLSVTDAATCLGTLMQYHDEGIEQPVPFLPECSYAFASTIAKGKTREDALQSATKVWQQDVAGAEGRDPYWRRIIDTGQLFDEKFEQLSIDIYAPLFKHWDGA